jgi:hypothetical protein
VDSSRGIARIVLQHTRTIHDRIDSAKMWQPVPGCADVAQIKRDPSTDRKTPCKFSRVARDADHFDPVTMQPRYHRRPDQSVRA